MTGVIFSNLVIKNIAKRLYYGLRGPMTKKKLSPFCIRLSQDEREQITQIKNRRYENMPIGAFMREVALGRIPHPDFYDEKVVLTDWMKKPG